MAQIQLPKDDTIVDVTEPINYNIKNPVSKLLNAMELSMFFAEDIAAYQADALQFLFPFSHAELYGPAGNDHSLLDPTVQDNKTDFQKQNIKDFFLTDTHLVRGWASAGQWTGPFLKLSYRGDPDSALSIASGHTLQSFINVWAKIQGKAMAVPLKVPYNQATNRYEVELWSYPGNNLFDLLSDKGKEAMQQGVLVNRPDLLTGTPADFAREDLNDRNMYEVAPENSMHPLLPFTVELAWADHTQTFWDSNNGNNYHYAFTMILRGWNSYMQAGVSANPHGGIGFLHYRNLLSNYKPYTKFSELSRPLEPWMFDAYRRKGDAHTVAEENFLAVEYMDLHILKAECAIGIHRHRDNQEIFFLLNGKALMVTGDWYQFPDRERAFEIRTLLPGSFTLLKAGQLHSLINALDIDATLLMFGGYD